jgi:tRNA (mo5U34)-methyltransferase
MRNVWAVPGGDRLLEWVCEAGFAGAEIVDVNQTSLEEQRATPWMRFESLEKAIDPGDRERTIEGHPRPRRALLIAQAGQS